MGMGLVATISYHTKVYFEKYHIMLNLFGLLSTETLNNKILIKENIFALTQILKEHSVCIVAS